tara:strand:+ start:256 stop:729 length:474 start_codon:yes stop_codon:yes gene_type:complete
MEFPAGRLDLYLVDISEPHDNDLRVVVLTARGRGPLEDTGLEIGEARRIQPLEEDLAYELVWPQYVAYAMRSESYARLEDQEMRAADSLHTRRDSAFLAYVAATTFASDEYPGPLTHWSLDTLNHCLDVVSDTPPTIRSLSREYWPRSPTIQNWAKS